MKYKSSGKLRQTMIAHYKKLYPGFSDDEAYEAWKRDMRARGSKGGTISRGGGFTGDSERARAAGRIGGLNRGKKYDR